MATEQILGQFENFKHRVASFDCFIHVQITRTVIDYSGQKRN